MKPKLRVQNLKIQLIKKFFICLYMIALTILFGFLQAFRQNNIIYSTDYYVVST